LIVYFKFYNYKYFYLNRSDDSDRNRSPSRLGNLVKQISLDSTTNNLRNLNNDTCLDQSINFSNSTQNSSFENNQSSLLSSPYNDRLEPVNSNTR